ncbi:MAG: NADH-quinone oxidoreductase subunit A [Planctomycetota bacterium]|nr:NADH-quinone oxidoreductase subunit A [Planctomycetota bacterium]
MPSNPLAIAAYLSLFAGVGLIFLFANLLVGRFVRPANPHQEKLEIYECGEPSIGSSFVQFDLRFYVVALLFIIFDVEVAFFFPWATVFGKATNLANQTEPVAVAAQDPSADGTPAPKLTDGATPARLSTNTEYLYRELGIRNTALPTAVTASKDEASETVKKSFSDLAKFTLIDIGIFFAVLIVGFFYVWKRGDLDWVRAVSEERALPDATNDAATSATQEPVLSS